MFPDQDQKNTTAPWQKILRVSGVGLDIICVSHVIPASLIPIAPLRILAAFELDRGPRVICFSCCSNFNTTMVLNRRHWSYHWHWVKSYSTILYYMTVFRAGVILCRPLWSMMWFTSRWRTVYDIRMEWIPWPDWWPISGKNNDLL